MNLPVLVCLAALVLFAGCTSGGNPAFHKDNHAGSMTAEELMENISASYPAPGRLIDVDGRMMHIRCTGEGSPVVIMEAGSGDCSLSWALVQQNVSEFTRVCTYDRAGYGWSDPASGPVTAHNVTSRLHVLLSSADIPPPYVLAGHSLGGIYVRYYAHEYPGEVAGMVLVDPGSEWQASRTGENFTREMKGAIARTTTLLEARGAEAANGTFAHDLSLVEPYCNLRLPAWEYHAYRALWATRPAFWRSCAEEGRSAFSIWDEAMAENITLSRDIPLMVISSGQEMGFSSDPDQNAHANEVFRNLQKEMAAGSPQGKYLVAHNSSHYVQLDEPEIVTESIRDIVEDIRKHR